MTSRVVSLLQNIKPISLVNQTAWPLSGAVGALTTIIGTSKQFRN